MDEPNTKVFRPNHSNRAKFLAVAISVSAFLIVVAVADRSLVEGFIAVGLSAFLAKIFFSTRLEVSSWGIKYFDGVITIAGEWQDIEQLTKASILFRKPALTYKKWAFPIVWGWGLERRFLRTINLGMFESDWIASAIGRELSKYVPEKIPHH
jgi:hypothetical protein